MRKKAHFVLLKLLYLFPFIIFFPPFFKSAYVSLFVFASLFFMPSIFPIKKPRLLIISCLIFFVYAFSLFYSSNPNLGFRMLETKLSLFLVPISFLFFLSNTPILNKICYKKLSSLFLYSSLTYSVLLVKYFFIYTNPKYPNIYTSGFFQSAANNLPLIGEHHIYISLILAASILFFLGVRHATLNKIKGFEGLFVILVFMVLWILQARSILISLALSLLILYWSNIKKMKSKKIFFIFFLGAVMFFMTPQGNNRFLELSNYFRYNKLNSASQRVIIYNCTKDLIIKNPIVGVGLGTTQRLISNCFQQKSGDNSRTLINTHNQYFDFYLTTGIWGLVLFFWFQKEVLRVFKFSENQRLEKSVFFLFSAVLLFENLFDRQTGVIFVYFFTFILIKRCTEKK